MAEKDLIFILNWVILIKATLTGGTNRCANRKI
jgi:hypothetical protein